jgi:hypothetical protein
MQVHHRWYQGRLWEAPDEALVTLCATCHTAEAGERRDAETELIDLLRQRMLSYEVTTLVSLLAKMPDRVLYALARGGDYVDEMVPLQEWIEERCDALREWRERRQNRMGV